MTINKVQGTGFAQIANAALRDKRLSFKARGVLAMVLSYTGEWDSPRDWLETMSDKDGRDAIQSALNELTDLGYRKVVKRQKPDGTWITEAHWFHTPGTDVTEGRVFRPSEKPSVGGPVLPPEHHLQNTKDTPGDTSPMTEFTLLPQDIVKAQRVTKAKTDRGYAFDEWWAIVPKKVDKGHAERSYRKALTKTTHEVLMEATRNLIGWNALGPRQYIPNPATWLNGERWADETAPSNGNGGVGWNPAVPDDNYL
jgi:hypothetical protein